MAPAENPVSRAKVALGRRLFYDADLSIDGTTSCGGCHVQRHGFADSTATHPGIGGTPGRRNVMALANIGYFTVLTWADPRVRTLEAQVLIPTFGEHPIEMGMGGHEDELVRRLSADPCYPAAFATAFPERGGRIDTTKIAMAIAAFERTLISFDADFDRAALGPSARRGWALFSGARLTCGRCHAGRLFTDADAKTPLSAFHRIEPPTGADRGLAEITLQDRDAGLFRTPSLRNVAVSGPYLHDGSALTLEDAVRRHVSAAPAAAALDGAEMRDLLAFLETLTDRTFLNNPDFSLPKSTCEAQTGRRS